MLPPPTTIAASIPSDPAPATTRAISRTTRGSIPYSWSPRSASPDSFKSTRRVGVVAVVAAASVIWSGGLVRFALGRGGVADRHPGEARHLDVLAQQRDLLDDQVPDGLVGVAVLLIEERHSRRLEPLVEATFHD